MEKSFRRRIRNINSRLVFFLKEGEFFHVGILFEDYLKSPLLQKYGLSKEFSANKEILPLPKGSVTKVNINGKLARKLPEEKETIIKHIDFIRKKDGVHVEYDRSYNVYKKVLLHKYNLKLNFSINRHNQQIVSSDVLEFTKNQKDIIKNTHSVNMFLEIFNDFEIYNSNLEPAINFNTKFEKVILPSGTLADEDSFEELIKIARHYTKNETENKAYQKRLETLKVYEPDIRGKGPDGFFGYIVFGFTNLGIIVLETMYEGNATYIFDSSKYEAMVIQNKQSVLNGKLHLKRIKHNKNWEINMRHFFEKMNNKT